MKYRPFGKTGWEASVLGFGTMRLPTTDSVNRGASIDETRAAEMLHYAIDHGINYIDTAYPYHRMQSEVFLGRNLQGTWRQRVRLATKLPSWKIEKYEDFDLYFHEQLDKLKTDHIDLYLLHSLNKNTYDKIHSLGVLEWAAKTKEKGDIGLLGFSFHDQLPVFKSIIDSYEHWDFCQIQYNYMNTEFQAGTEGLKYANARGISVVVMEPLFGGKLAHAPLSVKAIFESSPRAMTPPQWAFHWVWNQPEVNVVLSGMSDMQQMIENIETAESAEIGLFNQQDLKLIDDVRDEYNRLSPIPCTACNYCQPCPSDVAIPNIFALFNQGSMYDDLPESRFLYGAMDASRQADNCIECGTCEAACPQFIEIIDWLKRAHAVLAEGKTYQDVAH